MAKAPFRRLSRLAVWAFLTAQRKRRERRKSSKNKSWDAIFITLAFASLEAVAARVAERSSSFGSFATTVTDAMRLRNVAASLSAGALLDAEADAQEQVEASSLLPSSAIMSASFVALRSGGAELPASAIISVLPYAIRNNSSALSALAQVDAEATLVSAE